MNRTEGFFLLLNGKDVFTLPLTAVDKSFIDTGWCSLCSDRKPPAQLPSYTGIDKCVPSPWKLLLHRTISQVLSFFSKTSHYSFPDVHNNRAYVPCLHVVVGKPKILIVHFPSIEQTQSLQLALRYICANCGHCTITALLHLPIKIHDLHRHSTSLRNERGWRKRSIQPDRWR